jgi:hypothetical protein
MTTRHFALIFGIVFTAIGIAGFIPGLVVQDPAMDHVHLFGLFAVNTLHNLVHLAFGVWGLLAYKMENRAHGYAVGIASIYGVLTVAGLIPGLNTMFGLVPLYGHDVWLHGVIALVAAWFAWGHRFTGHHAHPLPH